jgi:hypothetical protein
MSKYVLVDTISQFRMRYVVEVPDDVENPKEEGLYPCTPFEYASDSVTCEDVREFSQQHLGETIVSCRNVTLQEAIEQYRLDNEPICTEWSDEKINEAAITEIGFNREEYYEQEEREWRKTMS